MVRFGLTKLLGSHPDLHCGAIIHRGRRSIRAGQGPPQSQYPARMLAQGDDGSEQSGAEVRLTPFIPRWAPPGQAHLIRFCPPAYPRSRLPSNPSARPRGPVMTRIRHYDRDGRYVGFSNSQGCLDGCLEQLPRRLPGAHVRGWHRPAGSGQAPVPDRQTPGRRAAHPYGHRGRVGARRPVSSLLPRLPVRPGRPALAAR
jgi:hypothetical protein